MSRGLKRASVLPFVAALTLATAGTAVAQDSLAAARDLYASAAYEDALVVLNRLRPLDSRAGEGGAIEQYRAFCLLALGRAAEAEHAIEAIVAAEPSYRPSNAEVSPRVRSAFSEVRRRMLPAIIQQKYAQAKAAFDRKEFAAAAESFNQVLGLMAEPDVASAINQPPFSDLRTLAVGFHDLSVTAAAPPPPPPPPPQPATPPASASPTRPAAPRIYSSIDANVVPPIVVRQLLPPFPSKAVPSGQGIVEVVVDETGAVEAATMIAPVSGAYDRAVLDAAKTWQYKPATLGGAPVKFRKDIRITFKPSE